jgi:hypothetical protein
MNRSITHLFAAGILLFGVHIHLEASVVQVQFLSAPSGVNDGSDYVLPYAITVNGITKSAVCYDIFDNVVEGQTWYADELTVAQAANGGFFGDSPGDLSKYQEVGWLSLQTYATAADQIDLQHVIWNVFGDSPNGQPYAVDQSPDGYSAALASAKASGYQGFDFSRIAFLVPVDSIAGNAPGQAFVIDPPSSNTPEPGTVFTLGTGLLIVGAEAKRRRCRRLHQVINCGESRRDRAGKPSL